MATNTHTRKVEDDAKSVQTVITKTAGAGLTLNEAIIANQTNKLINGAVPLTGLKSFFLYADKACTLKTNSSSVPDDELDLAAGEVIEWCEEDADVVPLSTYFTEDISVFYLTNTLALTLQGSFVWDPTP